MRSIDENVGSIIETSDFSAPGNTLEVDSRQFHFLDEITNIVFERPAAHQVKPRIRKRLLHLSKRPHHYVNTVVGMKASRTHQVRTQWIPYSKRKLGGV